MSESAIFFLREKARRCLEWAECARRDAHRAVGQPGRNSYVAAAERWEEKAVELKRRLWRESGTTAARRRPQDRPPLSPKLALDGLLKDDGRAIGRARRSEGLIVPQPLRPWQPPGIHC